MQICNDIRSQINIYENATIYDKHEILQMC